MSSAALPCPAAESIQTSARPHNITVIQVCAPTSDHEDVELERFHEQLDSIVTQTPKKYILVVRGDWNAKVGPNAYQHWAGTVGTFGTGETNDRGWILLQFAKSHRLTLANTLHPHKLSRPATRHAHNGQVHNQINFILTSQCFKSTASTKQTQGLSQLPTLAAIMTSCLQPSL